METFIHGIPKAELHVHIEGTLEPELLMRLAAKNGIALTFKSPADLLRAYDFENLQSFLDIYYQGTQVLLTQTDFYDLTWAYLQKAREQNVCHSEIFFDPQIHTARGIEFASVVTGIQQAMADAETQLGLSSKLIMCILRHLSVAEAMDTLETAWDFRDGIAAVGLDSSELGYPPERFKTVFDRARQWGFRTVAHAGEEGPPEYIWQALKLLHVDRIDHGVRCLEDAGLVEYLVRERVPLTVCPLSNVRLKVFDRMQSHNLKKMLELGLRVTVNSDDPAYFGGYIEENFLALYRALGLNCEHISTLVRNAFQASFLNSVEKQKYLQATEEFITSI